MSVRCISFVFMLLSVALPARGSLITTETRQFASATICVNGSVGCAGATRSTVTNTSTNSTSHSNNFDGGPDPAASEARTAARTGSTEIAANATVRHRNGSFFTNYTEVLSDALFEIDIVALAAGAVYLDFHLPPGFVEVESNQEMLNFVTMAAGIQADIQFCTPACPYNSSNPGLFQMFADLRGNWLDGPDLLNGATSVEPSLDLTALRHTNVNDVHSQNNFVRTMTWQYSAFTGRIFLGNFGAGQTFTVSYRMNALAANGDIFNGYFPAFQTWAAAAINDPFFLSGDPLPNQPIFTFTFVAIEEIPEPATAGPIALGIGLLLLLRRRSHANLKRSGWMTRGRTKNQTYRSKC